MQGRQENENLHAGADHDEENVADGVVDVVHPGGINPQAGEIPTDINGLQRAENLLTLLHRGVHLGVVNRPHRILHPQKQVGGQDNGKEKDGLDRPDAPEFLAQQQRNEIGENQYQRHIGHLHQRSYQLLGEPSVPREGVAEIGQAHKGGVQRDLVEGIEAVNGGFHHGREEEQQEPEDPRGAIGVSHQPPLAH